MQDRDLICVMEVVDDSTSIWRVGEIEYGIKSGVLIAYLECYGAKGRDEIIRTLDQLKGKVDEYAAEVGMPAPTPAPADSMGARLAAAGNQIERLRTALGEAAAEAHARCPGGGPFTSCSHQHCQRATLAYDESTTGLAATKEAE